MTANIIKLEYPLIKSFDPQQSKALTFEKLLNAYQWGFILVSLACILWYLCIVILWDTLACIINPKAYLPSTGMALAFIYLAYILLNDFVEVFSEKKNRLKTMFKALWQARILTIIKKMSLYIWESKTKRSPDALNEIRSNYNAVEEKLRISEHNLLKIAEESVKNKNFILFFFALVRKETALRNDLEKMLLEAPFNFNKYMTQLLGNILFTTKSSIY
jgi:hypothetical protein